MHLVLAEGLGAMHCASCGGVLLDLNEYRRWRSRQPAGSPPVLVEAVETGVEPEHARSCPACQRLMSRHRAGTRPDFRIDRCNVCQLVWLDQGEWPSLVHAGLATQLDTLLTDAWQQRLKATEMQALRDAELCLRLGEETWIEVRRIQDWLANHPKREEILALLANRRFVS